MLNFSKIRSEHLTEQLLGEFLNTYVATNSNDILYNQIFECENTQWRPDYRLPKIKLIVEFDGYRHYSDSKTIYFDELKNQIWKNAGYTVIRIPYFVQLDKETALHFFGKYINNVNFEGFNNYPHGFISSSALLPASFCQIGVKNFNNFLNSVPEYLLESIMFSLFDICYNECIKYNLSIEETQTWVFPVEYWLTEKDYFENNT